MNHSVSSLLLLGFTCRALAQCAKIEGLDSIVIDECGDKDTREAALYYCDWPPMDVDWDRFVDSAISNKTAISPQYCLLAGGTENNSDLIECLSRRFDNVMNPSQFAMMRSWSHWKRWANGSGLRFPDTWTVDEWTGVWKAEPNVAEQEQLLLKQLTKAGGLGVQIWEGNRVDKRTIAASLGSHSVLQKKIEGDAFGVTFLSSVHGSIAMGCVAAWPTALHPWGPFIYHGSLGPVSLSDPEWGLLDSFASTVSTETDWVGLWQADFIRRDNNWYLLEINPRWTASMEILVRSARLQLVHLHCLTSSRAMQQEEWIRISDTLRSTRSQTKQYVGKKVLYASEDTRIEASTIERWWNKRLEGPIRNSVVAGTPESIDHNWIADIPSAPVTFEKGYPICTILGSHENLESLRMAIEISIQQEQSLF